MTQEYRVKSRKFVGKKKREAFERFLKWFNRNPDVRLLMRPGFLNDPMPDDGMPWAKSRSRKPASKGKGKLHSLPTLRVTYTREDGSERLVLEGDCANEINASYENWIDENAGSIHRVSLVPVMLTPRNWDPGFCSLSFTFRKK